MVPSALTTPAGDHGNEHGSDHSDQDERRRPDRRPRRPCRGPHDRHGANDEERRVSRLGSSCRSHIPTTGMDPKQCPRPQPSRGAHCESMGVARIRTRCS